MATTTKPHMGSTKEALAPELIDMVCKNLETDDSLSFRMVCRDMHDKADDAFLNRFFTHRRQLITEFSLQNFLALSKQRRLLSKLKSVDFVLVKLNKSWYPDEREALEFAGISGQKQSALDIEEDQMGGSNEKQSSGGESDAADTEDQVDDGEEEESNQGGDDDGDDSATEGSNDSDSDDEVCYDSDEIEASVSERSAQRELADVVSRLVCIRWDAQLQALGNLLELSHITKALKNLMRNGIYPALLVSCGVWYSTREALSKEPAYGIRKLHRDLGLNPEKYDPSSPTKDLYGPLLFEEDVEFGQDGTKLLLKSIAKADFPIQDLTASSFNLHSRFKDLDLGSLNTRLHFNLAGLRRLSLTFQAELQKKQVNIFSNFIAAAPAIQELELGFNCYDDQDDRNVPRGLVECIARLQLSSLELGGANLSRGKLRRLLEPQRGTLSQLKLSIVGFGDPDEEWAPILDWLRNQFNLTHAVLMLRQGYHHDIGSPFSQPYEGAAAVQDALIALAQDARAKALLPPDDF